MGPALPDPSSLKAQHRPEHIPPPVSPPPSPTGAAQNRFQVGCSKLSIRAVLSRAPLKLVAIQVRPLCVFCISRGLTGRLRCDDNFHVYSRGHPDCIWRGKIAIVCGRSVSLDPLPRSSGLHIRQAKRSMLLAFGFLVYIRLYVVPE
jgi:hypothetical protein